MTDPTHPDTEHPTHENRHTRKWWLLIATAVLLLALLLTWRFAVAQRLSREIAAHRADGYPTTIEELNDQRGPPPPPEENGADLYREAYERYVRAPEEDQENLPIIGSRFYPPLEHTDPLTDEMLDAADRHIDENTETLDLLYRAGRREQTRFRDRIPTDPDRLTELVSTPGFGGNGRRAMSNLLALNAMVHAERGEADEAARSLRHVWRLGDALEEAPFQINHILRAFSYFQMTDQLERVLNHTDFSEESLAELQETLTGTNWSGAAKKALTEEFVLTIETWGFEGSILSHPYTDTLGESDYLRWLNGVYRGAGLLDMDQLIYVSFMRHLIGDAAGLPMPRKRIKVQRIEESIKQIPDLYTQLTKMNVSSSRSILTNASTLTDIRNAQAALAVERYRLAHDRLPDTLADLTPEFLDAVPLDPFTGDPLKYIQHEEGYTVYSVGKDSTDNGGIEGYVDDPNTDIPFTVKR